MSHLSYHQATSACLLSKALTTDAHEVVHGVLTIEEPATKPIGIAGDNIGLRRQWKGGDNSIWNLVRGGYKKNTFMGRYLNLEQPTHKVPITALLVVYFFRIGVFTNS
jgi:hypothetical protein